MSQHVTPQLHIYTAKVQLFLFRCCAVHTAFHQSPDHVTNQKPCDPYRLETGHGRIAESTNI
jgi:hypothetical protein